MEAVQYGVIERHFLKSITIVGAVYWYSRDCRCSSQFHWEQAVSFS